MQVKQHKRSAGIATHTRERGVDALVFDFDGVIADSTAAMHQVIDDFAASRGVQRISRPEMAQLTLPEILARLGVEKNEVRDAVSYARQRLRQYGDLLQCHEGISEVLASASAWSIVTGIVSSNSTDTINVFLAKNLPHHNFDFVIGDVDLEKKADVLKQWVGRSSLNPRHVLYVGDEVRDIDAAGAAGVRSVAVTWGKDSERRLTAANPSFVVREKRAFSATLRTIVAQHA